MPHSKIEIIKQINKNLSKFREYTTSVFSFKMKDPNETTSNKKKVEKQRTNEII